MTERAGEIRAFLVEQIRDAAQAKGKPVASLNDTFDLFQSGVFDSLGFVTLVAAVEQRFDLEIDFADWDPEEFTTLGGLTRVVAPVQKPEDV